MKKKSNNLNLILIFCIVFCSFSFANNLNTSFIDSTDSLKKYYITLFARVGGGIYTKAA
jgi:Na+/H+-translocating membrane pyrophosphatase